MVFQQFRYHEGAYDYPAGERIKNAREQELLIRQEIDLSKIRPGALKIIVPNEFYRSFLRDHPKVPNRYKSRIIVDRYFFNEKNPVLEINDENGFQIKYKNAEVTLKAFIKGSAQALKGVGGQLLGPTQQVGAYALITAKDELNIPDSLSAPFSIFLHDEQPLTARNKQDWLVYSNDPDYELVMKNHTKLFI